VNRHLIAVGIFVLLLAAANAGCARQHAAEQEAKGADMEFNREGLAGTISTSVERVTQPGQVQVAARDTGAGRWVCILVNDSHRCYSLDQGVSLTDLPGLREKGFAPPPPPLVPTMSICRSLAKSAMDYHEDRGDRIIVLLCPKEEWDALRLRWPR
jgi:hypothetical protein